MNAGASVQLPGGRLDPGAGKLRPEERSDGGGARRPPGSSERSEPNGRAPGDARRRAAVVRPLRGRDEQWLYDLPLDTPHARLVTDLLVRCVVRLGATPADRATLRALSVGDRDFLMLAVYRATFGDSMRMVLRCTDPECGAPMDADLPLDALPVVGEPAEPSYRLAVEPGHEVLFRLPCGSDLEDASAGTTALLGRCVLAVDGVHGPEAAHAVLDSPALRAAVEAELERVSPRVETEIEAACPECGRTFDVDFDPTAALVGEAFRRRAELDHDVHLLSLYYHWPLGEILGLARDRRKAHLATLTSQLGLATTAAEWIGRAP
jgi:hypothetical protein